MLAFGMLSQRKIGGMVLKIRAGVVHSAVKAGVKQSLILIIVMGSIAAAGNNRIP